MKPINSSYYIKRNRQSAIELYGDLLDENRRVKGMDVWFDSAWRIHVGGIEHES